MDIFLPPQIICTIADTRCFIVMYNITTGFIL